MNTIKVNKTALLTKVIANRREHVELYAEAKMNFRKKQVAVIESLLREAKAGRRIKLANLVGLAEPEDHSDDYDRKIAMLKMSLDDEIHLTEEDFSQLVQDNWRWRDSWLVSNSGYSSKIAKLARG